MALYCIICLFSALPQGPLITRTTEREENMGGDVGGDKTISTRHAYYSPGTKFRVQFNFNIMRAHCTAHRMVPHFHGISFFFLPAETVDSHTLVQFHKIGRPLYVFVYISI